MSDSTKEIVLRAWTDPEFKSRLLKDPSKVFEEHGVSLGEKSVKVLENTSDVAHFVLPESPDLSSISDKDIGQLIDSVLAAQLVLPTILDAG